MSNWTRIDTMPGGGQGDGDFERIVLGLDPMFDRNSPRLSVENERIAGIDEPARLLAGVGIDENWDYRDAYYPPVQQSGQLRKVAIGPYRRDRILEPGYVRMFINEVCRDKQGIFALTTDYIIKPVSLVHPEIDEPLRRSLVWRLSSVQRPDAAGRYPHDSSIAPKLLNSERRGTFGEYFGRQYEAELISTLGKALIGPQLDANMNDLRRDIRRLEGATRLDVDPIVHLL